MRPYKKSDNGHRQTQAAPPTVCVPERTKYGVKPFHRLATPSFLTTYDKVCIVEVYLSGAPSTLADWLCIRVLAESCRQTPYSYINRKICDGYGVSGVCEVAGELFSLKPPLAKKELSAVTVTLVARCGDFHPTRISEAYNNLRSNPC